MTRFEEFPPELRGLSIHECFDASNECRHGRLPFDKGPRCGCWFIAWRPKQVTEPDGYATPYVPDPTEVREKHHVYPEHLRFRAVQLYRDGMSLEGAAGRVGACRNSVRAWVVEAGVEVRGRWAA